MSRRWSGPAVAVTFAAIVVMIALRYGGAEDCPRGSVTAAGIARCR